MQSIPAGDYVIQRYEVPDRVDHSCDDHIIYTYFYFYVVRLMSGDVALKPWSSDLVREKVAEDIDDLVELMKKEDNKHRIAFFMAEMPNVFHTPGEKGQAMQYVNSIARDTPGIPLTLSIKTVVQIK